MFPFIDPNFSQLVQRSFSLQWIAGSAETHSWSKCQGEAENSVLNRKGLQTSPPSFSAKAQGSSQKRKQKEPKSWRIRRNEVKFYLLGITWLLHSVIPNGCDCLHKFYLRSSQPKSQSRWGLKSLALSLSKHLLAADTCWKTEKYSF